MAPKPCLTVVTLGVADMQASIRFYEALGFARRAQATGEQVAFFDAGGVVLALWPGTSSRRTRHCRTSRGRRRSAA